MSTLLTSLITIIIMVIVYFLIKLCIVNRTARIFVSSILIFAYLIFIVYCFIDVNKYFSAEGGVFGQLSGLFKTNETVVTDLDFDFKNVELLDTGVTAENGNNIYSAEFTVDKVVEISNTLAYRVYINGVPCRITDYSSNYIVATYSYNFYNSTMDLLLTDTLNLSFSFYKNYTSFIATTEGGTDAVNYWQYYFKNNNFIVSIKETDETLESSGILDGLVKVSFYLDDSMELTSFYISSGSKIPAQGYTEEISSNDWEVDGSVVTLSDYTFENDTVLKLHIPEDKVLVKYYIKEEYVGSHIYAGYCLPTKGTTIRSAIPDQYFESIPYNNAYELYPGSSSNESDVTIQSTTGSFQPIDSGWSFGNDKYIVISWQDAKTGTVYSNEDVLTTNVDLYAIYTEYDSTKIT